MQPLLALYDIRFHRKQFTLDKFMFMTSSYVIAVSWRKAPIEPVIVEVHVCAFGTPQDTSTQRFAFHCMLCMSHHFIPFRSTSSRPATIYKDTEVSSMFPQSYYCLPG